MYRILLLLFIFMTGSAVQPAEIAEDNDVCMAPFPPDAPKALVEAWLRIHEEELCLGTEPVFVFKEGGLEVWSLVEDEKHYRKLLKLLQPLSQLGRVEIFAAESVPLEDSYEDGPPPSLWENGELRKFYRVPERFPGGNIDPVRSLSMIPQEEIYEQRLIIFSSHTIQISKDLQRYAMDLPPITCIALDPSYDSDLRSLAFEVCREHARGLEKQIGKLSNILSQAIPKGSDRKELRLQDIRDSSEGIPPLELAARISDSGQDIAQQVHSFIYPDSHTVELDELRNPGILDLLTVLREMDWVFLKKISRENEAP